MTSDRMARSYLAQAAYRLEGVEPPHWHDVGEVLLANASRLHPMLQAVADGLARISADLRQDREAAFYGDEVSGRGPGELFGHPDASQAQADAGFVVERVRQALAAVDA